MHDPDWRLVVSRSRRGRFVVNSAVGDRHPGIRPPVFLPRSPLASARNAADRPGIALPGARFGARNALASARFRANERAKGAPDGVPSPVGGLPPARGTGTPTRGPGKVRQDPARPGKGWQTPADQASGSEHLSGYRRQTPTTPAGRTWQTPAGSGRVRQDPARVATGKGPAMSFPREATPRRRGFPGAHNPPAWPAARSEPWATQIGTVPPRGRRVTPTSARRSTRTCRRYRAAIGGARDRQARSRDLGHSSAQRVYHPRAGRA